MGIFTFEIYSKFNKNRHKLPLHEADYILKG